ncbi:MAG: ADP-glyceromanno-heptose 6-epimerase [Chitinophagaceae bacterium]
MIDKNATILITGAAGFIGSCLTGYLNSKGFTKLILVDEFSRVDKEQNLAYKQFSEKIERELFFNWLSAEKPSIDFAFHIGARTDTTEFDYAVHQHLNVEYSQLVWNYCTLHKIPLVYASSAATYGNGELGYNDNHEIINSLHPLNPYGISKNEFDKWVLQQDAQPPFWAGLKFFNVYGPNEYHKRRMASVIFHSFHQIKTIGKVKLFRSHLPEYKNGEQLRDFVYVKDVLNVCYWLMDIQPKSGIYNLGTGMARSFNDLVKASYASLDLEPDIEYVDMPEDIRDKYQYFTEAKMEKLRNAGYHNEFFTLEKGIDDYVKNFLVPEKYY